MPKSLESADGGGQLAEATRGQAGRAARQEGLQALAAPHLAQVRSWRIFTGALLGLTSEGRTGSRGRVGGGMLVLGPRGAQRSDGASRSPPPSCAALGAFLISVRLSFIFGRKRGKNQDVEK